MRSETSMTPVGLPMNLAGSGAAGSQHGLKKPKGECKMWKRNLIVVAVVAALFGVYSTGDAEDIEKKNKDKQKQKVKLDGIKCLFCKMDVSKDAFVEYKGAKVFFGCAGCPEAFKRDTKKFATKANAQLVATKQARQKLCPISGKPYKDEFKLDVAKAKVAFCCSNCKDATAKLKGEAQLEKLFSEATFKKAFRVPTQAADTKKS